MMFTHHHSDAVVILQCSSKYICVIAELIITKCFTIALLNKFKRLKNLLKDQALKMFSQVTALDAEGQLGSAFPFTD